MRKRWTVNSKTTVFNRPPWLSIEEHAVTRSNGTHIPDWSVIITGNASTILAIKRNGLAQIMELNKYCTGETLAPYAGYVDKDEDPEVAAKRELKEESGLVSDHWIHLGDFIIDANRGVGTKHLYLALDCTQDGEPTEPDSETIAHRELTIAELKKRLLNNEFKEMSYALTVSLALVYLKK